MQPFEITMKLILINICICFISALSFSQIYEIGGFIGGSNFIGDVGSTTYINPNEPAFGGVIKWNRSHEPMEEDNWKVKDGIDGEGDGFVGFIHNCVIDNYLSHHESPC